jgi:two-component system, NtrC family, response regulator HydG
MSEIAKGKILVVDDDEDVLQAARVFLRQNGHDVKIEKSPMTLPDTLRQETFDLILLDMNFTRNANSGTEGFYWLRKIREADPNAVVVLITAYGDIEQAVRAMKDGASDFVMKPWQNEKLLATVSSAMELRTSRRHVQKLESLRRVMVQDKEKEHQDLIGESPNMQRVLETIRKVARTDANVLILGESGTGKELIARELHRQSRRAEENFITVDMGALDEGQIESDLFGMARTAGGDPERPGRFELANRGTLFLDEVAMLSAPMQGKMLNALENKKVTHVGGTQPRSVEVRLICATHQPIKDIVEKKEFRADLLYRINTVEIQVPPLRDRKEDIPALAEHFINVYSRKYQKSERKLSLPAMRKLKEYGWPGNVRELRHAIERAVLMSEHQQLQPGDFFIAQEEDQGRDVFLNNYNLDDVEKSVIRKVISKYGGNISQAAKELGLTRASLYRRISKYGL